MPEAQEALKEDNLMVDLDTSGKAVDVELKEADAKEVDKFLNIVDLNANHHFWSQTYYLMDRNVYDRILDITELDDYIIELCEKFKFDYDPIVYNSNSTSRNITVDDLSSTTYNKLKDYYKIDYDNGWY